MPALSPQKVVILTRGAPTTQYVNGVLAILLLGADGAPLMGADGQYLYGVTP